ncbi:MAG: lysine 2,3-aminomutase [Chloroflexi bacterium HGW-Chloroflexi-10]|nr:MAG: lysine 2,3-aminomutase [Chloroflexi bacterium HGW-Chloroflexi-10]
MTIQSTILKGQNEALQNEFSTPKYKPYFLKNYKGFPQIDRLTEEQIFDIEVVARVLPFRTNNYVINELIDWNNIPNDPVFILNFPQKGMLKPQHYEKMAKLVKNGADDFEINLAANQIRAELDPHPAGQMSENRPSLDGEILKGVQHKYRETMLFFPSQGQSCHAFCTFCFRWPQFTGNKEHKFAMSEIEPVIRYIQQNPGITDILFTGGDPLFMKTKLLAGYINALLDADIPNLRSIRIGSKALAYWPYRFLTDDDADDLLALFEKVVSSGRHLSLMAHFNHLVELETDAVKMAISRIRETGTQIRTQSPVMKHINDDPNVWAAMWQRQVELGAVPYYMFIARDTGAQHYFSVSLEKAWNIFRAAYQQVSGLARTVRGPVMSCHPGKVQVLGVDQVLNQKVYVLRALQNRNPDNVMRPFFAKYDAEAIWYDDLVPAFGKEKFFVEDF